MNKYIVNTALAMLTLLSAATFAKDTRPNILVILSDDAGYSDLGTFGGEIDTPNLDALAKGGMRFSQFYSNARCSPTRASLLTGVDAAHVGFGGGVVGDWSRELPFSAHRGRIAYEQPLISELLADNGYQTMMVGKWHLGGSYIKNDPEKLAPLWHKTHTAMELTQEEMELDYLALPPQRGFQKSFVFLGAQGNLFYTPKDNHPYYESNEKADLVFSNTYNMHCYAKSPAEKRQYSACHGKSEKAFYATDGMSDRAVDMLKAASQKPEPFFMYAAFRAPHKPLQAPQELVEKYLERYQDLQLLVDERYKGLIASGLFPEEATSQSAKQLLSSMSDEKRDELRLIGAVHAAMMEKIDENVGKMINELKASGEYDNTLILYFSDNGAAAHTDGLFNVPYRGVKALLWEGGARTHAIASWPGVIPADRISDNVVWVGDILPTLLEITQTPFPDKFHGSTPRKPDGRSVFTTLKGEKQSPPEAIFFNDKGQQSVVYQGRWKLLIEPGWYLQTLAKPGIAHELYDLSSDPGESNNLAKSHPELVEKLVAMCERWKAENSIVDYSNIIELKPKDPY
ncbi:MULTISPECIES: sulfatase-like hydrolase/transferase [Alteromonas]|uniref:Sulfatase-like hydrolase/transferase n=2 Tax=Alteromonas stellipolaris TaxID=233316 RepID=A0AAW7Z2S7_9ALTE|nr:MULTISPECIES: sulfatase-like hydrolase/transferase [Alteromonas]ALM91904.1 Arylsulfatase [Alteromonas stellipolaris LMG 21856]MDO6536396.1 sulfatase-like hydrolase/transferase [Alteromonas stellipolaris]MDO6576542.1 sulfatase-like hydrolase/transferase [Alteromonas stellipolaris]MDO6624718.1 sulfatase-like hydrolase/transferase [Alteromonas stellipolaris]MDP2537532.1 sulfatase-like hydrolase/transferase [Alteromonas stellipolaris]